MLRNEIATTDDLINNIFEYHITPNNRQYSDIQPYRNTLISFQRFAIFSSWIEKKNDFYIPYSFNSLYYASRDSIIIVSGTMAAEFVINYSYSKN